jgi:DNA-binding IclR family transcriptional regulator
VIQSVDRAVRILQALAAGPGRLGVSELSQRLGLAKTTVHGLLRTLQVHGLVEQRADSDKYQLGPELLQLSHRYLDLNELRARSLAWADRLANRTGESVRVGALHAGHILIVHHVFRPDTSLQILEVGELLPIHATALGKAVLAHLPDDVRDDMLEDGLPRLTGHTLTTVAELRFECAATRERGYAVEREEAVLGDVGVAAAIFDRGGQPIGAVGVIAPRERLPDTGSEQEAAAGVMEAARGISRELGATYWSAGSPLSSTGT